MRVHDPPPGMRRFAPELEISARLQIELRASRCQLANPRRPFFDKNLDCLRVCQRRTGRQSVQSMQLRRISGS